MSEEADVARLWESFPKMKTTGILTEKGEQRMARPEVFDEHLHKLALHFYRGGVAAIPSFKARAKVGG